MKPAKGQIIIRLSRCSRTRSSAAPGWRGRKRIPPLSVRRIRKLVDLARQERWRDRAPALRFYDRQDRHMAYARACHARRVEKRLVELGFP